TDCNLESSISPRPRVLLTAISNACYWGKNLRIFMFMPRNMRFGPTNASSIDLCVRDLISASKYRNTTTVLCCENESLFPHLDIRTYSPSVDAHKWRKAFFAAAQAKGQADLIVVQNHLPTAAALARRVS